MIALVFLVQLAEFPLYIDANYKYKVLYIGTTNNNTQKDEHKKKDYRERIKDG